MNKMNRHVMLGGVYDFFDSVQEAAGIGKRYCNYGYTTHPAESMTTRQENLCRMVFSAAHIQDGHIIVDAGCGSGEQDLLAAELYPFKKLIGINISRKQINYAKRSAKAKNLEQRLSFFHGKVESMDMISDGSTDSVVAIECAHHFDRLRFYEEAARILKSSGKLVLADMTFSDFLSFLFPQKKDKRRTGFFSGNRIAWENYFKTVGIHPIRKYVRKGAQRLITELLVLLPAIFRSGRKLTFQELILYMQMIVGTQMTILGFILGLYRYDLIILQKKDDCG